MVAVTLVIAAAGLASDSGMRSPAAQPLPRGRLQAVWDQNMHDLAVGGYDRSSRSIALHDASGASKSVSLSVSTMVVDAATGLPRWQNDLKGLWVTQDGALLVTATGLAFLSTAYPAAGPSGWSLAAVRLTDGEVEWQQIWETGVSTTSGTSVAPTPRLASGLLIVPQSTGLITAIDPADGQQRWTRAIPAPCTQPALVPGTGSLLAVRCMQAVYGLNPVTGATPWQWPVPTNAVLADADGTATSVAVIVEDGPGTAAIVAVDLRSGRPTMQRPITGGADEIGVTQPYAPPRIHIKGNVVVAEGAHSVTVVTTSGSLLATLPDHRCSHDDCLILSGRRAILTVTEKLVGDPTILAIDATTRKVAWRHPAPASTTVLAGGTVYAMGPGQCPVCLSALTMIDPETGTMSATAAPWTAVSTVAIDGQTLWLTHSSYDHSNQAGGWRLGAFEIAGAGEGYYGGVAAERWPDACAVLADQDLGAINPGARYMAVPAETRANGTIPQPRQPACSYASDNASEAVITIRTIWITEDPEEARQVAVEYAGFRYRRTLEGVGDLALLLDGNMNPDVYLISDIRVLVIVSGCAVEISAPGDDQLAVATAPLVARRLGDLPVCSTV
ncbi:MAG: PQQ-binding-like beta-propeller repeat protein [Micromonosporaceae bacterium]|nr:PQQ-binding-like beta-propeller repeat protein [Micromonosporaceae bacterium]